MLAYIYIYTKVLFSTPRHGEGHWHYHEDALGHRRILGPCGGHGSRCHRCWAFVGDFWGESSVYFGKTLGKILDFHREFLREDPTAFFGTLEGFSCL